MCNARPYNRLLELPEVHQNEHDLSSPGSQARLQIFEEPIIADCGGESLGNARKTPHVALNGTALFWSSSEQMTT